MSSNDSKVVCIFNNKNDWDQEIIITNNNNFDVLDFYIKIVGTKVAFNWIDMDFDPKTYFLKPKEWSKKIPKKSKIIIPCGIKKGFNITKLIFMRILPPFKQDYDDSNKKRGTFANKIVAPYVDVLNYPIIDLVSISNKTKHYFYNLAFIVANTENKASWGGLIGIEEYYFLDKIFQIRNKGGDVCISFGGANGQELSQVITDVDILYKEYQKVIDMYQLKWIDFDIEGGACNDMTSIDRRNKVIKKLKENNKDLIISYTLPVMPYGLVLDGINLLKNAKLNNVSFDILNLMQMDYGPPIIEMGKSSISSSENTISQLNEIGYNDVKIGCCPMIGEADVDKEIFTLNHAKEVLSFAKKNDKIRLLTYWSLKRDCKQTKISRNDLSNKSGIIQEDYDFLKIFKQ